MPGMAILWPGQHYQWKAFLGLAMPPACWGWPFCGLRVLTGTSLYTGRSSCGRNFWVSGLSSTTRATDLKNLFSRYGKVSCHCPKVSRDNLTAQIGVLNRLSFQSEPGFQCTVNVVQVVTISGYRGLTAATCHIAYLCYYHLHSPLCSCVTTVL